MVQNGTKMQFFSEKNNFYARETIFSLFISLTSGALEEIQVSCFEMEFIL